MSEFLVRCCLLFVIYSVESYEYGYHPSSEEFDSLLREKSWTRDLLWQEHNLKKFTPKFNLEKPKESIVVPEPTIELSPFSSSSSDTNNKNQGYTQSNVMSLSSESFAEVNKDSNHTTLPIFFTNPATGIVYAITEVGVNKNKTDLSNTGTGTIPIFVSKEQYERDLYILKKSYEAKCVQNRPAKVNSGNLDNNFSPSVNKKKLVVKNNRTRVSKDKKRKNHNRKFKKLKEVKKAGLNLQELIPSLDTQLEKPGKIDVPWPLPGEGNKLLSVFSRKADGEYSLEEETKTLNDSKFMLHKISRRSLNSTEKIPEVSGTNDHIKTRSINSSDSSEKPKKILSTQIQVTSEYVEPTLKIRTPKNSIEETTRTEIPPPPKQERPPCKESKPKAKHKHNKSKSKKPPASDEDDEYDDDDDYSFGGTSYNDYDSGSDENDDDVTAEDNDSESSIENVNPPDYGSLEEATTIQQDHNYRHKKTTKKRIKRRRPYNGDEYDDDYDGNDDDYDNESDDGVFGLFRSLFTPVQWVMDSLFDRAGQMLDNHPEQENVDNRKPKFPQYTVYNGGSSHDGALNSLDQETDTDQGNSLGSWFGSWFGFKKRRSGSTTPAPSVEDEPGWFESWFGYDDKNSSPNEEEGEPWFFGWFNSKPRPKRTTTTTTTTTPVPILTISEPLKNPHKWIGILAQHIINSTSTNSPLIETSTENPDIPRKTSYNKYQIWRIQPKTDSQVKVLDEIKRGEEGARLQWLKGPTLRGLTDVVIPQKMLTDFGGTLGFENIDHEILIFDVGKVISYEQAKQEDMLGAKPGTGKPIMSWNRYYDYDSIIKYLELIQIRNAQYIELIHIGRSYEGRPLVIAKIEFKKSNEKQTKKKKLKLNKKPDQANAVFIEAGVHGREWIAPASATWMINELLKVMKNNHQKWETKSNNDKGYNLEQLTFISIATEIVSIIAFIFFGSVILWIAVGGILLDFFKGLYHSDRSLKFLVVGLFTLLLLSMTTRFVLNKTACRKQIAHEQQLLAKQENGKRTNIGTEYIKNTTWYIMPVANPDGYEYSHLYDRFWKKSRSRHISKPNGIIDSAMTWLQKKKSEKVCFGVDLDCNWHYNWGRKGSSKSPCNEFFAGPTSFSEPESRAISKFLMDNRKQLKLFVSLQAYGQIISYPNKVNSSFQTDKLDDLLDVAMVASDSLRKKGSNSRYKVDATNDLIVNKAGTSDYFASFEAGIPFSYTIYLADNGVHGYLLPSTFIEPTARDAFDMITAMIDYI